MNDPNAPASTTTPLTLAGHAADWRSLATALTSGGRPVLSNLVRTELAGATRRSTAARVALSFVPAHAAAIQRTAANLGIRLAPSPANA